MRSDMKLAVKNATDANHLQIRCLRDPNPMEDAPDQDSANNTESNSSNLIVLTRAIPGIGKSNKQTIRGAGQDCFAFRLPLQ